MVPPSYHRGLSRARSRLGSYFYLDGGRYEGEWVDDKINGKGKSIYANNNVYEGDWVDGRIRSGQRPPPHVPRRRSRPDPSADARPGSPLY